MLIDCARCVARYIACGECVVRVLLDAPLLNPPASTAAVVELDAAEQAAIGLLAEAGLVPPLRLVRPLGSAEIGTDMDADIGADTGPGGISSGSAGSASRGIA